MSVAGAFNALEHRSPVWDTWIRAIITGTVIVVSYAIIASGLEISGEWEAVLLVVVGYYFNDRPAESLRSSATGNFPEQRLVRLRLELFLQFLLALLLIVFTLMAFLATDAEAISGAWIAAVVLAVAFYFKEIEEEHAVRSHSLYRTVIALTVVLITPFFLSRFYQPAPEVPLQWIGLVVIVVAFYFKERSWEEK